MLDARQAEAQKERERLQEIRRERGSKEGREHEGKMEIVEKSKIGGGKEK